MDILIKNMEMPKYCAVCPLRVDGLHTFQCVRLLGRAYTYELEEQRQEDCPLVEIPEHGELKDCSVLLHYLAHMRGATEHDHALLKTFEKMIRECPTIVEATE